MSTVTVPPVLTSPRDDATQLHKAFKGFGCDTAAVVNILAHRDFNQRSLIQHEYKSIYGEDLCKRLKSELSGNLEKAVLAWMPEPAWRDAAILGENLNAFNPDIGAILEIICTRTPSQLQQVKQLYHVQFKTDIEKRIKSIFHGHHEEGPDVDMVRADHDAQTLYKAGEKKLGTDEKKFITIFSESSRAHLLAVNNAYHNMYGKSLKKVIKSETSGLFRCSLSTILLNAENPGKYFAKLLHASVVGLGTSNALLIRIIVTRTEIDMQYIKVEYHKKYGKTLNDVVQSETSGDYRNFLLALLGPSF